MMMNSIARKALRGGRPWMETILPYGTAQWAELVLYALLPIGLAGTLLLVAGLLHRPDWLAAGWPVQLGSVLVGLVMLLPASEAVVAVVVGAVGSIFTGGAAGAVALAIIASLCSTASEGVPLTSSSQGWWNSSTR